MNARDLSLKDLAPANVRAIAPYIPGKPIAETARELGIPEERILKMASNENPLGPSPKAIEAIRGALATLNYYPDGSGYELKRILAGRLGVTPGNIVLGNGSNDVLELVARAFLRPGESALYSQHAFMVYPLVVQAIGATGIEVPARDYGNDLDALAAAVREDTRIVFVANPGNPTGTFSPWAELERFAGRIPAHISPAWHRPKPALYSPSRLRVSAGTLKCKSNRRVGPSTRSPSAWPRMSSVTPSSSCSANASRRVN